MLVLPITASSIEGSFILAAAYGGCDPMLIGAYFTIAVGSQGLQTAGDMVNPMDLSPNYSGTITALSSGAGCIMGVLVPVLIGLLTPNVKPIIYFECKFTFKFTLHSSFQSLLSEWRVVFWITVFVHIAKIAIFTAWGSAKVQPWNNQTPTVDQSREIEEKTAGIEKPDEAKENAKY